ncbi:MAG: phosphoadenosine phosphosulfate reductase family protein [Bacteroidales bacterium]|nr:phosphoadenosine phosphosulfate reductase family protein [Bacteroidales bacterium]
MADEILRLEQERGEEVRDKVAESVALIRRAEPLALRMDPENGFYLAFSGGKDSQVLHRLCEEAGVRFKAHMACTSIDPPEMIRFVRRNYPDVEMIAPKASIYTLVRRQCTVPTRVMRWCCEDLKEVHGGGTVTLTGIRAEESARRAGRGEVEEAGRGGFSGTLDQWEEQGERRLSCVNGREKVILNPILGWTRRDVWAFLDSRGIPHCSLYDEGYGRVGCVMCPMAGNKARWRDSRRYPQMTKLWKRAMQWLIDTGHERTFRDPETFFRWWLSGKSREAFVADELAQGTLDFDKTENI